MEHIQPPEESGREMAARMLGETLGQLRFEESPLMTGLRDVIADAMRDEDPLTALAAYARYQEVGQELVEASADRVQANLALNIACARLLAMRGEQERFFDAIGDCILNADIVGQTDVSETLRYFLT